MSWLDFACGVASRAAKKLQAEYEAGRRGEPPPVARKRAVPSALVRRSEKPVWREVLGVPEGASLREVTAAYRRLIARNHPDKVAHLSERIRRVAEEETLRINAAYEVAQRLLGRGGRGS